MTCLSPVLVAAPTQEMSLGNGLKVIVREDHRAPTVVHMVWYPVGSIDETDNISGISHLLEHMMFKGTQAHGPGEFSRMVALSGGRDNAFTSQDYTAYFEQIPKEKLAEMMTLEADRMVNLRLLPEELKQEAKVVMEERRMRTEDDPQGLLQEALWSTAFKVHPYRRPVIGWMSDLENISVDDLRKWYQTWYSPSRATVVVVGDVDTQEVFRLAQKIYGPVPAAKPMATRGYQEPPQRGIQRIVVKAPAELPRLDMNWKVPSLIPGMLNDAKARPIYALSLLTEILSGYDAARLQTILVRGNRTAVDVRTDMDVLNRADVTLWSMTATPSRGHTVAELEKSLRNILEDIRKNGVSEQELQRAKVQMRAQRTYEMDSMFTQALWIGRLEVSGFTWQGQDVVMDNLEKVTSQDIQQAIVKYLIDDHLTVGVLDPQPLAIGAVGAAGTNRVTKGHP